MSDLNWDWLSGTSDCFKELCDFLNLAQLINAPKRPNPKVQHKSTLLDLIITNTAHKFNSTGIFCNDVSDHCVIACVRNTKIPKLKPNFLFFKRYFKNFEEQAFLHDLYNSDLRRVTLIQGVELAWEYFQ